MTKLKIKQNGEWIDYDKSIYYDKVKEENILLKYRINKAIEKVCMLREHYFKEKVWGSNLDFNELLDILRGKDE